MGLGVVLRPETRPSPGPAPALLLFLLLGSCLTPGNGEDRRVLVHGSFVGGVVEGQTQDGKVQLRAQLTWHPALLR